MVGLLGIVVLMLLMFLIELPVGVAMGLVGLGGIWWLSSPAAAFSMLGTEVWSTFSNYGLTVIPLFVWMGQICFYSGVNESLYNTAYTWMGRTRGGLAMATILACAGFAAICGSNTATAATMTSVALPEMRKRNYEKALMSGSIACGSTLGVVIPPSVVLLVYGIYTEQSIGKLFWASTVPGLVMTALFCFTIYILCLLRPESGPGGPRTSVLDKIKAIPGAFEMIALFSLVMSGLLFGWYTPTEAGAAGTAFALIIALIRRKISWTGFVASIVDTVKVSCMIIIIVTGAVILGRFLTMSGLPTQITEYCATLNVQPWVIMAVILVVYGIAGCVMDALGFLLVSIPIFFPLAMKLGYDPIWFGVIINVVTTLGAITPPVGICAYVVAGMSGDIPLGTVFRGVIWFIPVYVITMVLLILYPQVALWLPSYVR
ncbi:MAG TPA: TRAP transporter large permease [Desulfomonilaceae bacterium]|nr:TRAP transporter large permease [Desulfomonilaceae bacterium]HVN83027.1 TRAP transporter large permease [Terriglobia bacterium]